MVWMIICIVYILTYVLIANLKFYFQYKKSSYKDKSGNSFKKTRWDRGISGEFLTYVKLENLKGEHKLFTNLYLPKADGKTTEIDLVMLDETGIYVFESKNYRGWIFGNEDYRNWSQTFKNGKKYKFYNPIWQNKGHINALKAVLGRDDDGLYKSYIVFSERCTLKKINVVSPDVKVMKRKRLGVVVKKDRLSSEKVLCKEEILELERELRKYCLVGDEVKVAHVAGLRRPANIISFPEER
ncbi:MAG TPA: NERD nuclease [Firmicutes bacterium]|nr:NERD nuclease [Bacillota bacterium]